MKRVLPIAGMVAVLLAVTFHQAIYDQYILATNTPGSEVAAFAERMAFTEKGQRIFYVARPEVDAKEVFNGHCPVQEDAAVLGCYYQGRIFVLDVTKPELAGIKDVTAAHEMLHAAYARLSSKQRRELDALLEAEFAKNSDQLGDIIALYESHDAGQRLDEIHSRLGTEVATLSPELEAHYARYFSNRQAIVTAHQGYEDVFNQLKSRQDQLDQRIESLRAQIDELQAEADGLIADIESMRAEIERLRSQGRIDASNDLVEPHNQKVAEYRRVVDQLNGAVTEHNSLVAEYNGLNLRQQELYDNIDSTKPNDL